MSARFNPPPGWPAPPQVDWLPETEWRPETNWPRAPRGWPFYIDATTGRPCPPPAGVWIPGPR